MKCINKTRLLVATLVMGGIACKAEPPKPRVETAAKTTQAPLGEPVTGPAPPATDIPPLPPEAAPVGPTVVGMEAPFKLMNTAGARTLDVAWKALRRKEHSEARAAFHQVVTAYPDKPAARLQELRMAAIEGDLAAVPGLWKELLARDFIGYAHRLDSDKEMALLRKSPTWDEVQKIKAEMKSAFIKGLDKGFFFVARIHPYGGPSFPSGALEAKLALDQEAYHFDPRTRKVRRLSDTGGRVLAIHHDGENGRLLMLVAGGLKTPEGKPVFSSPEATMLDLTTLERQGPLAIGTDALSVDLCVSGKGEPLWSVTAPVLAGSAAYTLDATRKHLVKAEEVCGAEKTMTSVSPMAVEHTRPDPEGVELSEDGLTLSGVDEDLPVRATSTIRAGSLGWSPGKKRFVYTGEVDRCALERKLGGEDKPAPNALLVWDAERKRAAKVAASVSAYEAQWIDDDLLAYAPGLVHARKLVVHDFSGGESVTLETPAGAGLSGVATLGCNDELQALAF